MNNHESYVTARAYSLARLMQLEAQRAQSISDRLTELSAIPIDRRGPAHAAEWDALEKLVIITEGAIRK